MNYMCQYLGTVYLMACGLVFLCESYFSIVRFELFPLCSAHLPNVAFVEAAID